MLVAYPPIAAARSSDGELPLHVALCGPWPDELSRLLLGLHPDGAATADASGVLPLQRALDTRRGPPLLDQLFSCWPYAVTKLARPPPPLLE
eukprot:2807084-Prymnesium_polylepis.1